MIKKNHEKANRVLAALIVSFLGMSVADAAEPITSKVILTDQNTTIDKDINLKYPNDFNAVTISKSAFGKDLQIHSDSINVNYNKQNFKGDVGIIQGDTGYTGTISFRDGMSILGTVEGLSKSRGFGILLKDIDDLTNRNTGKPVDGVVHIGNHTNINISQTNGILDPTKVDSNLSGMRIMGQRVEAGNGLHINIKSDSNHTSQVFCIEEAHYTDFSIGNNASFSLENETKGIPGVTLTDIFMSGLQYNNEKTINEIKGYNALTLGNHGDFRAKFTSDSNLTADQIAHKQELMGIRAENTKAIIGDANTFTLWGIGSLNEIVGICASANSDFSLGDDTVNRIRLDGHARMVYGYNVYSTQSDDKKTEIHIGDHSRTEIMATGDAYTNQEIYGIFANRADMTMGDYGEMKLKGANTGNIGETVMSGTYSYDGTITIGNHLQLQVDASNYNLVGGMLEQYGHTSIGDDASIMIRASANKPGSDLMALGLYTYDGSLHAGDKLHIGMDASNYNTIAGLFSSERPSDGEKSMKIGNDFTLSIDEHNDENHRESKIYGIYSVGDVAIGDNAAIRLHTTKNNESVVGVCSGSQGITNLGNKAYIFVDSPIENSEVVEASEGGQVIFQGAAYLAGNSKVIRVSDSQSLVSLTGNGQKILLGNVANADKGKVIIKLNTADSLLRGASAIQSNTGDISTTDADTDITVSNGALWEMTDNSQVTTLNHERSGIVDMTANSSWNRLDIHQYEGNSGIFRMDTDLQSGVNGDKMYIDAATDGSSGLIQVNDDSFLKGQKVVGTNKLLLVTDKSKKATFQGLSLDKGGLWEVTPTIRNGSYVRDAMGIADAKDTEWYLTMLTKKVNRDTQTILDASNQTYGQYRTSIDTLRKRMGDLRLQKNKEDVSGIWARVNQSEYEGTGYSSKHHGMQIGYDYAVNPKSVYGFLWERGLSSSQYSNGSGRDHGSAAAIYGTWFGDSGSYTDVVAKWGRDDIRTYSIGNYPDAASYRTNTKSISIEYGKTKELNDQGLFMEPQTQLVLGRLGKEEYMTARGKIVHMDSYDSGIFRLGVVLGQRRTQITRPFDYYVKVSMLHEFGGNRNIQMTAKDGESLSTDYDYRGTWYTAGLGFTCRLNDNTYVYADAERSYGGDWHQKWQGNVGIHWRF